MGFSDYIHEWGKAVRRGLESYFRVRDELDRQKYVYEAEHGLCSCDSDTRDSFQTVIPILWGSF